MQFNDFITKEFLFSFLGIIFALEMFLLFFKDGIKARWGDAAVRPWTAGVAFGLLLLVYWHQGLFDAAVREIIIQIVMALINAIIVTIAAMGGYEAATDLRATKEKL